MAEPPAIIQQLNIPTVRPLTNTFPVLLWMYVQSTDNTRICGKNTNSSDINGPPKVEPNKRSAPGPIPAKKGMYIIKQIINMPPAIHSAFFHQHDMNPLNPGILVAFCRI